jgi:hypothetical protein
MHRILDRRRFVMGTLSLVTVLPTLLTSAVYATPSVGDEPGTASQNSTVLPSEESQSIAAGEARGLRSIGVTGGQSCLASGLPAGASTPSPFLKLPFREQDGVHSLWDSEGWYTSPDELSIDGEVNGDLHGANDLEFTRQPDNGYGLPVVAATSGRAYYSYQYVSGSWTDPATGQTHQVGYGAGLVVEVRQSQDQPGNPGWVTQYIHLSRVAHGIPYLQATAVPDPNDPSHPDWFPSGLVQDDDTLWNEGVPVKQGQIIGYQGDTGIGFDWKDNFNPVTGKVLPRNRLAEKAWDPPQLHFQLYQGRINGAKQNIIDPFGLYAQVCPGELQRHNLGTNPYTPVPGVVKAASQGSVFVEDHHGNLLYAAR